MAENYQLYIWLKTSYSVLKLDTTEQKSFTLSTDYHDTYYVPELEQPLELTVDAEAQFCLANQVLELGQIITIQQHIQILILVDSLIPLNFDVNQLNMGQTLSLGANVFNEIQLALNCDFLIKKSAVAEQFQLIGSFKTPVYLNHRLMPTTAINFTYGDVLEIDCLEITLQPDNWLIVKDLLHQFVNSTLFYRQQRWRCYPDDYPEYHRSPRVIRTLPQAKITLDTPPMPEEITKNKLLKTITPPLVMVGASVVMAVISHNMTTMIMMGAMSLTTTAFAISSYFNDKKEQKQKAVQRTQDYHDYLQTKIVEIQSQKQQTRAALTHHLPAPQTISQLILSNSARIYEKNKFQADFLTVRLGLGNFTGQYQVNFAPQELMHDELLEKAKKIYQQALQVEHSPLSISLLSGGVGLIGDPVQVNQALQSLVLQIVAFQSYHDVRFVPIFDSQQQDFWQEFRWLKHFRSSDSNTLNFVDDDQTRDQILTALFQLLKAREQTVKEAENQNQKINFAPYYVLIVQDEELIINHGIMEYLSRDISELNVAVIFVKQTLADLPEHIETVVEYYDSQQAEIVIADGQLTSQKLVPDSLETIDLEATVRHLAALDHKESLKNSLPASVGLLELYDVKTVEELQLQKRWSGNLPYKSLAVPLGLRGKDDLVKLDLHERAHGPHGLIAGTTGSGKSELIQSYIASLAINFHPDNVAFLLIDYKGGGMANLFSELPHLLGTITNLDGSQSLRALASIKAELEKRQQLFGQYQVNHINEYQRLYHDGVVKEAMPHLFLISDEFAELKSEQPDFMQELVSTARIGRSLGIHLILATQKPSGVVNEQIWSNSRFKIALKVQDQADSNEILHTPDAASIVEPGRAYLQVGNNEIYELFQSAYSGQDYQPMATKKHIAQPLYLINELGQYENLSVDLSGLTHLDTQAQAPKVSELTAVIDYIAKFANDQNIARLPHPWLPPLAAQLFLPDYVQNDYQKNWSRAQFNLRVTIGLVDYPDQQAQRPGILDVLQAKHLAVFGSSGYGKSTFVQTFILSLCQQNSPALLNIYLLDFGTNGLLPLRALPHVADLIQIDETEKVLKFQEIIEQELNHRKQLLSLAGVASLEQYLTATSEQLPIIEIVIDAMDSAKEVAWSEQFNYLLDKITREGANVGIYLIITANRQAALRMQLLANIKTQISLFLFDRNETTDIVGRSQLVVDDQPGRGLMKLDTVRLFQTLLPAQGGSSLEILENVKQLAQQMQASWTGELPDKIPMIPEELTFERFQMMATTSQRQLALGLDTATTKPIVFDFDQDKYFMVLNDTEEQQRLYDRLVRQQLAQSEHYATLIIDDQQSESEIVAALNQMEAIIHSENASQEYLIYFDDFEEIVNIAEQNQLKLLDLLHQGQENGLHIVINTYLNYLTSSFDELTRTLKAEIKVGILGTRLTDQDLVNFKYISNEDYLKDDEGYYFKRRSYKKIRIPK